MSKVTAIDGGKVEEAEFVGHYLGVEYEKDGSISVCWSIDLPQEKAALLLMKLQEAVNLCFILDRDEDEDED